MVCSKCGNDKFYTKVVTMQYYDANGETCGYEIENAHESKFATCTCCGKRIALYKLIGEKKDEKKDN